MKCVTNSQLNFLKVKTELGAILLNHTWVGPLSVVGKTLHMISSGAPWRCMRVLNDSRWSKGSFDPLYASICGILNLVGRGKDMTSVVNGELIQWTSMSKLVDIQPFKAFIIKSIFSFIVCISCTMCKMLISSLEERLVSYWSCLLTMLLSSWSSLSWWSFVRGRLLLRLSLSCVSLWSFNSYSFRYSNCCSNLWFRWVSHSIAAARVCTFLFNALGGLLVSWLVVAIDRVRTIQLFVIETTIWLITHSHKWRQLMMHKNRQWVDRPHMWQWVYLKNKIEEPIKGHRWDTSQRPSEG